MTLLLALTFALLAPQPTTTYTLTLDQPNPARGSRVTFTGTFPQAAFRQAHNPQFHSNPYLTLSLFTTNGWRLLITQPFGPKTRLKNPDGSFTCTSYPVTLEASDWPTGAVTGVAASGYWTDSRAGPEYHSVASTSYFTVAP